MMTKNKFLARKFLFKILFRNHYFSPFNTSMKKRRIREAQKHTDPMNADPDPEHWFWETFIFSVKYSMESGPSCQSSGFGSFIYHMIRETIFWVKILQFFDADPDSRSFYLFDPGSGIRDANNSYPGWKKFESGIRDKQPGSATLVGRVPYLY